MAILRQIWHGQWRRSSAFLLSTVAVAIFTDVLLYGFMVPLLPYLLVERIQLEGSIQQITLAFLSEGALVSVTSGPLIGHCADKIKSKKALLLYSLAMALFSSVCLSLTKSLTLLFVSRFFQALASNALWIVGVATLANSIGSEHMGKISGMISTATAAGTSAGPAVAGILFEIGGYWVAWTGAFTCIGIDTLMRLLLFESPETQHNDADAINQLSADDVDAVSSETSPLHPHTASTSTYLNGPKRCVTEKKGLQFYMVVICNRRFATGILCYFWFSVLVSSFDATIPIHVQGVFNWGTFQTGLLFAALQGPGIILSPLCGWLKDRLGSRYPSTIGFLVVAGLLVVLGIPGDTRFHCLSGESEQKAVYLATVMGIGFFMSLLNGVGPMEVTLAIDEIQGRDPGIFGDNGGYSRALALTSMSWTLGMFVGPMLSGSIADGIGYFEMNCVLGILCILPAGVAFFNLGPRC